MAIDKSGTFWRSPDGADLDSYLQEFTADGYPATRFVHARCERCDGERFSVSVDDDQGCAQRTCVSCGDRRFMLDSEDFSEDAHLEGAACPCGGEEFDVAAGFAFYEGDDVRWVYLGLRCVTDGILGCYADWKIDYGPSAHLLGAV